MKKRTHEQFIQKIKELVNDEYVVLSEYINNNTHVLIKHASCGLEWKVKPGNFLSGRRCPKCIGKNIKKTTEVYKKEVKDLTKNEYEVMGEYNTYLTKILMKHCECGYEWSISPSNFIAGNRCPMCVGKNIKKNIEQFKEDVARVSNNEYVIMGEYVNNETKILIRHEKCGHTWNVIPRNFMNGTRCPKCQESRGEKIIESFLLKNKIKHICQAKFDDCKDKRILPFDFYIPDENICIEYDGIQHYDYRINWNKSLDEVENIKLFISQLIRDNIKTEFCQKNNIKLIRIPYWEFKNIEQILLENL